jgi:hypothetical protein
MTTQVIHARRLRDGRQATLVRCERCGLRRWIIGAEPDDCGCGHDVAERRGGR